MHVQNINYTHPQAPELFCQSLKDTGFAVLNHHPISVELINRMYQGWRDFFYADMSIKEKFRFKKETQDGYFPFRSENAKGRKTSDLKEFFHIYLWGQIPDSLREVSFEMYHALERFASELLQWVENYLPEDVAKQLSMPLKDMIVESSNILLRVLHYPPLPENREEDEVRAAPHEDINLITLLPAATAPGLEVLDTAGNWHEVTCDPGNIVVNVGDMLQMCTQHYYKSTTHRVVNPKGADRHSSRFSMPLFLHPRKEVRLSPTHTAIEYLHERLREIGVY